MQDTATPLWKLWSALMIINTLSTTAIYLLVHAANLGANAAAVLFVVLIILNFSGWFYWLVNRLRQIQVALLYLNQNKPLLEMTTGAADLFKPLITPVNALIRQHADLKTMRGKLVDQISATAAQEERNRLARDLHDSIKQQVFSISISAAAAQNHLEANPTAAREALQDVKQSAQEAMVEMRAMLQQLSPAPLEKVGLVQALRDQCEALAFRTGAQTDIQFGNLPSDQQLPMGAQETLFRIAQEALSNIARHARAHHVVLRLETGDQPVLTLRIEDDGQGFEVAAAAQGMGLHNIRSRAESIGAALTITSQPGSGTSLVLDLPLIEEHKEETNMQYEARLKPMTTSIYTAALGASGVIVAFSLIASRLSPTGKGITGDPVIFAIFMVLIIGIVVGIPLVLRAFIRAQQQITELRLTTQPDDRIMHMLKRHIDMGYIIVTIAAGWFIPLAVIGVNPWLPVVIGGTMLGFTGLVYILMYNRYKRELILMSHSERVNELGKFATQARSGWLSLGFLWGMLLITGTLGDGIRIPPTEADHWMSTYMITLACLLLLNQVISLVVVRRWLENSDALEQKA